MSDETIQQVPKPAVVCPACGASSEATESELTDHQLALKRGFLAPR